MFRKNSKLSIAGVVRATSVDRSAWRTHRIEGSCVAHWKYTGKVSKGAEGGARRNHGNLVLLPWSPTVVLT